MSDYAKKITTITHKRQKLIEEEQKLIEKRKAEIANLAEKCGILVAPDVLLAGLFIDIENAIKSKDHRLKEWQIKGERFLKVPKLNIAKSSNDQKAISSP